MVFVGSRSLVSRDVSSVAIRIPRPRNVPPLATLVRGLDNVNFSVAKDEVLCGWCGLILHKSFFADGSVDCVDCEGR